MSSTAFSTLLPATVTTIFCPPSTHWKDCEKDENADIRKVKLTQQNGKITVKQIEKRIYDKWSTHFNENTSPISFKMINSQNNQQLITVSDFDDWGEFLEQNQDNRTVFLYLFQYPSVQNANKPKPESQSQPQPQCPSQSQYEDEDIQHQDEPSQPQYQPQYQSQPQPQSQYQSQPQSFKLTRMRIYIYIYMNIDTTQKNIHIPL